MSTLDQHYKDAKLKQNAYIQRCRKELESYTDPDDIIRINKFLEDPQFEWDPREAVRIAFGPKILHKDLQGYVTQMEEANWFAEQANFKDDKKDWERLDDGTKHIVRSILGFFQIFDHLVGQNININFMGEINCKDAQHVYILQADQERIHEKSYILQPEAICRGDELDDILNAMKTNPIIPTMVNWISKYMGTDAVDIPIGTRLVAFAMVEGVWFSGAFCFLHWLQLRNVLPGITQSNEWIRRDEGIHTDFACYLISKYLIIKPHYTEIKDIVESATEIADEFINHAIPCRLAGMNAELMTQYIRFQADTIVKKMGYPAVFNTKNPFKFMETYDIHHRPDLFSKKSTNYKTEVKQSSYVVDYNSVNSALEDMDFY
jgi:ribonucleoside-diphosphate reductase beta chain